MSELTTCNYCTLKDMREAHKSPFSWERKFSKKGDRIYLRNSIDEFNNSWINVFRVHRGQKLKDVMKKGAGMMFAGMTDHCVC